MIAESIRRGLFVLAGIVATATSLDAPASAEPAGTAYARCQSASGGVTVRLKACDAAELRARDATLNALYRQLLAAIDAPRRARLQAAERAWIAFRDAECAFRMSGEAGGTMAPLIYNACRLELTAVRSQNLQEAIKAENL